MRRQFAPEAASSGIPEVMGYLNGVHIAGIMRMRTLVVKVFGSFCSVSSGLAIGPEGPLVHTGAIVGSGATRGHKIWRWRGGREIFRCNFAISQQFHNDTDRRDFISMGAAVGFATAFGAPIGGVLFALEEASSFWNGKLMWRTLTATTLGCFVVVLSRRYLDSKTGFMWQQEHKLCAFCDTHGDGARCVTAAVDHHLANGTTPTAEDNQAVFQPGLLTFESAQILKKPWENFMCVQ